MNWTTSCDLRVFSGLWRSWGQCVQWTSCALGNLPVGAVITLDENIIAEAGSLILTPVYHPGRHAEMEALRRVPVELWRRGRDMTCYTTLEPCVMCFGGLPLHGIGRIVFGAEDQQGGASGV